jgi:hypothetical protein
MAKQENPPLGEGRASNIDVSSQPTSATIARTETAPQGGKWRRHFIIRRRADWLRDVMANPRLGGPAKACAYALATHLNEKTMRTPGVPLDVLTAEAGMSRTRVKAGIRELIDEGIIGRRGGGMRPNEYWVIEPGSREGPETGSQTPSGEGPETGSQNLYDGKSDRPESVPLSELRGTGNGPREGPETGPVRDRKRAPCGTGNGPLYSNNSSNSGGARSRASAADTVFQSQAYKYTDGSLASADRARSPSDVPPLEGTESSAPESPPRDIEFLESLEDGGEVIEDGEPQATKLAPARPITDARYLGWADDQPHTPDHREPI